jgi:hypothetical protein
MCPSLALVKERVTWWHALLLACRFLDVVCDSLVMGNWIMFASEALKADDFFPLFAQSLFAVAVALIGFSGAMRYQDFWPPQGPLLAVAICRIVTMLVTLAIATIGWATPASFLTGGYAIATLLLTIVYAGAEAFDSVAFFLAWTRLSAGSDMLNLGFFIADYIAANLGIAVAAGITTGVRAACSPDYGRAGDIVFTLGAVLMLGVAVIARTIHRHYAPTELLSPPPIEKQQCTPPDFLPFSTFTFATLANAMAYVQMGAMLPKYMKRRFSMGVYYPMVQAINPLLVPPLTFLLPALLSLLPDALPPKLIFAGATLGQALSFLTILTFPDSEWGVVFAVVSLTVGEASWIPRARTYISLELLPNGKQGYYMGILALPIALITSATLLSSFPLLDAYCPEEGACSPVLWAWVAGTAALTPLALFVSYLWDRWKLVNGETRL